jgi:hypothetical protein
MRGFYSATYCHTSFGNYEGSPFSVTARHEVTKQPHSIMLEVLISNLQNIEYASPVRVKENAVLIHCWPSKIEY